VKKIYMDAWKMGCKGITVFRSGCKEGVFVKTIKTTGQKCDGDTCSL
jgi:ribonucleotide reductase alpha subunit